MCNTPSSALCIELSINPFAAISDRYLPIDVWTRFFRGNHRGFAKEHLGRKIGEDKKVMAALIGLLFFKLQHLKSSVFSGRC